MTKILLLLFTLPLCTGCLDDPPLTAQDRCAGIQPTLVLDDVQGNSLLVDGGSLYLHTRDAALFEQTEDGCQAIELEDVTPPYAPWRVGHDATQIAESYPAQAWPKTIVVERI